MDAPGDGLLALCTFYYLSVVDNGVKGGGEGRGAWGEGKGASQMLVGISQIPSKIYRRN